MKKTNGIIKNNKGFTLIELIATIVILALVMGISTYSISAIIKNSKEKNYELLINNIKDAAENYYQECKYSNNTGITCSTDDEGKLITTLKALVKYGYLKSNDTESSSSQMLINPKDNVDIINCQIKITYSGGNINVVANEPTGSCPTEY